MKHPLLKNRCSFIFSGPPLNPGAISTLMLTVGNQVASLKTLHYLHFMPFPSLAAERKTKNKQKVERKYTLLEIINVIIHQRKWFNFNRMS